MDIYINPRKGFDSNIGLTSLVLKSLFFVVIGIMLCSFSILNLLDVHDHVALFLLTVSIPMVPFFYTMNFIFSVVVLLFLVLFIPNVSISKFYSVTLTYNSITFFFYSFSLLIYILFYHFYVYLIVTMVLILVSIINVRILYYGLNRLVGFNKNLSKGVSIFFMLLNEIPLLFGVLYNVGK